MLAATVSRPHFILPDLFALCSYPLLTNPTTQNAGRASEQWLLAGAKLERHQRDAFFGLKVGQLVGSAFPHAHPFRLRLCCDVVNYLFTLPELAREFAPEDIMKLPACVIGALKDPHGYETDLVPGILAKDFFALFSSTAGEMCSRRFIRAMKLFFTASQHEAIAQVIPDVETYTLMRRNSSGCKPCFVLIQYANALELPDEAITHPIITSLEEAANDVITWTNDILSFNVEQARGEARNMLAVLMHQHKLSLKEAVTYTGNLIQASIERFENQRASLPLFENEEVDEMVSTYVDGLQHWMTSSLHWSFETERYFGKDAEQVKIHRIVQLSMPLRRT